MITQKYFLKSFLIKNAAFFLLFYPTIYNWYLGKRKDKFVLQEKYR